MPKPRAWKEGGRQMGRLRTRLPESGVEGEQGRCGLPGAATVSSAKPPAPGPWAALWSQVPAADEASTERARKLRSPTQVPTAPRVRGAAGGAAHRQETTHAKAETRFTTEVCFTTETT